jgi:SAM-dependent methyltransferase
MDRCHQPILDIAAGSDSALDLGCGDGRLLWKIARNARGGRWVGVEYRGDIADRGRLRHGPTVRIVTGTIEENYSADGGKFSAIILMPGRLLEMDPARAERIRTYIKADGAQLIVYAYTDVLARHGGLAALADMAKLRLSGAEASNSDSAASRAEVA